jgi:inorganic triphosphatase YgiF
MEIELKLLVAPADQRRLARLPGLHELTVGPVRSEQMRNVYYDTPDLDLSGGGVALRLREIVGRGRSRWVQTLKAAGKAAAGLHERQELEWPVASGVLDLAAIDASPLAHHFQRERVRTALKPAFATDFRRTHRLIRFADGTTAELAMDLGEIRAGRRRAGISEIELELREGDPARLFELAAKLGESVPVRLGQQSKAERGYRLFTGLKPAPQKARPVLLDDQMTAAAALRQIALACVAQMEANEAGVLQGRDPEYLHQFRVGMRRLRSCLSLLGVAAGKTRVQPFADELKWLGGAMNPARDWDVFMTETLPPLAQRFAGTAGLDALQRAGVRLRRLHNKAARDALASRRYQLLLLALGRAFAGEDLAPFREPPPAAAPDGVGTTEAVDGPQATVPPHPLDQKVGFFAASILARRDRKLRKLGRGVPEKTPEARHEVRIAAKRVRYAAEFFAPLYGKRKVGRYVDALEGIQDILGALNDAAVTDRLLAEAGAGKPLEPEVTGIVRGWFGAVAMHELGHFDAAWAGFEDAKAFWK